MHESAPVVPFGSRLRDLLAARGGESTQAWLAERSGIDRSLISRIIKNERIPTLDTLQALAPALEVDVVELVAGTDAESRLGGADHVRRSDYEEAVGKLIEYETKARDLEAQVRSLNETLEKEQGARRGADARRVGAEAERDRALETLALLEARCRSQDAELVRHKAALQRAIAQFSALKVRVDELQKELGEAKQSSKVSAILSGVAAAAGVATLAHFLGGDDTPKPNSSRSKKTGGTP